MIMRQTMVKMNCWEFKHCNRVAAGANAQEAGICPATTAKPVDGLNDGKCGGRCCWAIAGTFCGNMIQGTFAMKQRNCLKCEFFKHVIREQGEDYTNTKQILEILKTSL